MHYPNRSCMKTRTILTLLLGSLILLPVFTRSQDAPDTTFSLLFQVKMAKAVSQGIFNPDSGIVYAVSETGFGTIQLAAGANDVYAGVLATGLDSGQTYTFRFRINDTVYENVTRQITANPGVTEYFAWWNDDPINVTTFNVDMTYMVLVNAFDPATDSIDITGTINDWGGSPLMQRVDTSNIFTLSLVLDPDVLYKYKYRVNRDTAREEFLNTTPRYFRTPDTLITLNQFFYDFNPATVPLTLLCDMSSQEESGSFDTLTDYLDVAGSFNNGGAWDLLYLYAGDSIHRTTIFLDTALIGGDPLTFKFRINGDPAKEELAGKPPRSYTLHVPSLGNANRYFCWYDDINPNVPTPPWVTDLFIQGDLNPGNTLTGTYAYHNLNGIPEGSSLFKWYKADSVGSVLSPIDSAWTVNYTIDSTLDHGKYLVFEVTPVASSGDSAVGMPAMIYSDSPVFGVGIGERVLLNVRFYPNPVTDLLRIESQENEIDLVLSDMTGKGLISRSFKGKGIYTLQLSSLTPGTYIMYLFCPGKGFSSAKLVRQ
jgi:hypothetical protein